MTMKSIEERHISVLLNELVDSIKIFEDTKNIIVDCTLWMAGHASKMIEKMNAWDIFIWFDADERNLKLATQRLNEVNKDNKVEIILIHSNFVNLKEALAEKWITEITWIYYDLGLSSLHVDEADRWFSFREEGPLDMRFDASTGKPASFITNVYRKDQIVDILRNYWEESQAEAIAKAIINRRKQKPLETTTDLTEAIETVSKHPKVKTRVYQALRIETNHELDYAKQSIEDAISILCSGWYLFVISFHSLEDRLTKQIMKKETRDCICSDLICSCHHKKSIKILTKKPILPTDEEIKQNPRSRSAKARLAVKL